MNSLRQRYSALVRAMTSRQGVIVVDSKKKALGSKTLRVDGKIFATLSAAEHLVVRLPEDRVNRLVSAGRGAHFELSHGQPMKQWFMAGAALDESWLALAEEAWSFVAGDSRASVARMTNND